MRFVFVFFRDDILIILLEPGAQKLSWTWYQVGKKVEKEPKSLGEKGV